MPTETGSPEAQVILYAIQRGAYDRDLAMLAHAIRKRREGADQLGIIMPSKGDWVEIWDDPQPSRDVKVPTVILGAKLRVVGFIGTTIRGKLEDRRGKYPPGSVVKIDPDWVYRVHYYT